MELTTLVTDQRPRLFLVRDLVISTHQLAVIIHTSLPAELNE
jgi:hypothetical protein